MKATGTFEVKLPTTSETPFTQRAIDKRFSGDLDATSVGIMIAAATETKGSAGYVALERVTGTLHGKSGSFVLQHFGMMNRGASELIVRVVPDSGTGELTGLSGTMTIDIVSGEHRYGFEYLIASS